MPGHVERAVSSLGSPCLHRLFSFQMAPNLGKIFLLSLPGSPLTHSTSLREGREATKHWWGEGLKFRRAQVALGPQKGGQSSESERVKPRWATWPDVRGEHGLGA